MYRTGPLLTLVIACGVLIGGRGENGFRQLYQATVDNNETTAANFTNTNVNNTPWPDNNATSINTNTTNSTWTPNFEGRIIGGQIAWDRSQFSYQASLRIPTQRGSFHFCGATIIDQQHLLTAAHCVVSERGVVTRPSAIFAVVGDLNVAQANAFTLRRSISHIFTHHNYNPRTIQHDVAVLRVSQPFGSWTLFISPLPLATSTPPDHTNCTVSGWGVTETGFTSDMLRFVSVPIVPFHICRNAYGSGLLPGMLCAGYMQGGRDACQGDSGGPLACRNAVAGVVSWGYDCALPGYPGVYANVATYRNWINLQMQRSSSDAARFSMFALYIVFHNLYFTIKT